MTYIAEEYWVRFSNLVQNNRDFAVTLDSHRRSGLAELCGTVGQGLVHGNNDCCPDLILQRVSRDVMLPLYLQFQTQCSTSDRKVMCSMPSALDQGAKHKLAPSDKAGNSSMADASEK